jgi:choline monooxygenase
VRDRVFARSWQWAGDLSHASTPGHAVPRTLLPGCLDEPVLLSRDATDRVRCLSNVCTHRGTVLLDCEHTGTAPLRCRYHGRRFDLDGRFLSMPEFEGVAGFPSKADDLRELPLASWGPLRFTSLDPAIPFERWIAPVIERAGWIDLAGAAFDPSRSREWDVKANWALYCDNYLEGFHVPFVHAGLAGVVDYGSYRTELFEHGSLQVGFANPAEDAFDPPASSKDHGTRVAAYWFWLFPNLMLNFYPWGLSVNVVQPVAPDRCKVLFFSYVKDASRLGQGAGGDLDRVEREDEEVVEAVQRGVRSRLYDRGRYSPTREQGVHHFHRLLTGALA